MVPNFFCNTKTPPNNPMLSNKDQEQEEKMRGPLKVACDHWKYWKFQIH